jgi:hypothetical protein
MKNKIALATAALVAGSSFSTAEIVINDFLSFEGFVDMSYTNTNQDNDLPGADREDSENSYQVDQVEISWLFDFSPVTAQIDLEYEDDANDGNGGNGDTEVEQAFVTYSLDSHAAITAGRYASMLGFEAFEPTGLYQYSFAYDMELGDFDLSVLPAYNQGIKYTHTTDTTFFGISLQDSVYDNGENRLGGDNNDVDAAGNPIESTFGVEIAGSIDFGNGLTWFAGAAFEQNDDDNLDGHTFNTYLTYETGAWLFAAELNVGNREGGSALSGYLNQNAINAALDNEFNLNGDLVFAEESVMQFLLMANYAYSDAASLTARLSYSDHESDFTATTTPGLLPVAVSDHADADFLKFTLAHSYAFTDNLLLVAELSVVDGEFDFDGNNADYDAVEGAVELLFTF